MTGYYNTNVDRELPSGRHRSRSRQRDGNYSQRNYNNDHRETLESNQHELSGNDRHRRDQIQMSDIRPPNYNRSNYERSRSRDRQRNENSFNHNDRFRHQNQRTKVIPLQNIPTDSRLPLVNDDPRVDPNRGKLVKMKGAGRNTESFDPESTLVRPDMRIIIAPKQDVLDQTLTHDDVLIVPNFFCEKDDWKLYYQLIDEMRESQAAKTDKSEWVSWHEGAHLISHNPNGSKTYQMIQEKISQYFSIPMKSVGTRFNWYRDQLDWKPFHNDSAAFNPVRAKNQNITVGVSFGATRELAFLNGNNNTKIYFPQTNGMLFSFGRDVNIRWKHGINALPIVKEINEISKNPKISFEETTDENGKGRISIILWGLCPNIKEETDSPPILTDNTRGNGYSMHAGKNNHRK